MRRFKILTNHMLMLFTNIIWKNTTIQNLPLRSISLNTKVIKSPKHAEKVLRWVKAWPWEALSSIWLACKYKTPGLGGQCTTLGSSFSHSIRPTTISDGLPSQVKYQHKMDHVSLNIRGNTSWALMSRATGSLHRYKGSEVPYVAWVWHDPWQK